MFDFFKKIHPSQRKKGFTLVELLVVVSIISMLSSVVLSSVGEARKRAQILKVKQDFANVGKALELYRLDHGDYPTTGMDETIGLDELISNHLSDYMGGLPSNLPSWLVINEDAELLSGVRYMQNPRSDQSFLRTCGSGGTAGEKYFILLCSDKTYADDNFDLLVRPDQVNNAFACHTAGKYYCTHQPAN